MTSSPSSPLPPGFVRPALDELHPYEPGKPVGEIQREYDLDRPPVKLASNENPFGPPPDLRDRYEETFARLNRYPDAACHYLRHALADRLGWPVEGIFVGAGTDEVLDCLGKATLRAGDDVVTADPAFVRYPMIARIMGARAVEVPVTDAWDLDLEAMLDRAGESTRWFCLPNPNNPTSRYLDEPTLRRFLERVPAECGVVLDEAYFELMDVDDYPDGVEVARERRGASGPTLVVLRTFSKAYGLAGLRVGYGIMPPELARELHKVRPSFNVNRPAQALARAALQEETFVRRSRERLGEARTRVTRELENRGMRVVDPSANFVLAEVPGDRTGDELCDALLRRGVIVRSMTPYGLQDHVRISFGTSSENRRLFDALDGLDGL